MAERSVADETRQRRADLRRIYLQMVHMGERDMGSLTYAEASLFHGATDLIHRLLESLNERMDADTARLIDQLDPTDEDIA